MSQSPKTKKDLKFYVDKLVSIGAAVVIVGALFKILHWKFANELLIVGMFTEAGIFLVYAYLPSDTGGGGGGGSATLDSTELINALNDVKASIENTNTSLHVISSSTDGLKELESKFEAMGKTLNELNHFYVSLKNVSETVSSSAGEAARTKDQLLALANNLTEMNANYSNMNVSLKNVSETVSSSVGDAARTKDQFSTLANNLTEMNAIYSNMIHAIKGK
jgi:chromosome segregation ATPase